MAALHRSAWKDCRSRRRSYPTRWRFALNATSLHVVGNCADPINRVPLFIWTPRARTQNEHRRLWPTRVRGIGPPATAPEIGSARRCLLESPVPEHLRSTPECQRPAVDPHPRREPRTDNPPARQERLEFPPSPEAVAAQDDGQLWYLRGVPLGLETLPDISGAGITRRRSRKPRPAPVSRLGAWLNRPFGEARSFGSILGRHPRPITFQYLS
jgi:hypothetical protein